MSPDDPRHGTNAGHRAHYKDAEKPCRPCMDAHAAYKRAREARLYVERVDRLTTSSLGTARRIRALQAIGWPLHVIDQRLGHGDGRDKGGPNYVWNLMARDRVRSTTAKKVAALYESLCMTPGPSNRARLNALAKGWAPPLAWSDIDDPAALPDLGAPDVKTGNAGRSVDYMLEDAEWMADSDASLTEVLDRLDISQATFRDQCRRAGRSDLYFRIARREPDGDMRWEVSQAQRRKKAS